MRRYCPVQEGCRWCCSHQLTGRNIYQLSGGKDRLGQLTDSNVRVAFLHFVHARAHQTTTTVRSMLYHLITLIPHRDITLHVSINNPAMVRIILCCRLQPMLTKLDGATVAIQPLRVQSRRVHSWLLRRLSRHAVASLEERLSSQAPAVTSGGARFLHSGRQKVAVFAVVVTAVVVCGIL